MLQLWLHKVVLNHCIVSAWKELGYCNVYPRKVIKQSNLKLFVDFGTLPLSTCNH